VQIRIEGNDLPGRACGASDDFPGYENIHVGVQKRKPRDAYLSLTPGDAASATWIIDCDVVDTPTGVDFKGPYVQGRPHARFVYLSWGTLPAGGTFTMFRRAKLWLDAIEPDVLDAARASGQLVARIGLTDAKGHPLCAAVRPPKVSWGAR
jgi:uncharacterized protein DUF5990